MKKIALATTVMAVMASGSASAADLGRPIYKAPVMSAVSVYNWSGFYIGGYVGGAFTDRDVIVTETGAQAGGVFAAGTPYNGLGSFTYPLDSSFIGGGTVGWNWQVPGSMWVFGLEGEIGYLGLSRSVADPISPGLDTVSRTRIGDWYGMITGRVGIAWDRTLFYVKGGGAFVERNARVLDTCTVAPCGGATVNATGNSDEFTWTVGGGVEFALGMNWTIKAEYMYIDTRDTVTACGAGGGTLAGSNFCWNHELPGLHTAKIGLNYKFGGGGPIMARY